MRSIINPFRKIRNFIAGSVFGRKPKAGYCYRPGDVVIDDFAEFSGIPLDTVVEKVANFHRINAHDWHALDASSFSERAAVFYESSQNYIFDTLSANPSPDAVVKKLDRFNPHILESIRVHPGKRFIDFGGGVGTLCELVARMGKAVCYLDVPGIVFDFAQWRFKRLGLNIAAIEAKADSIHLPGKYDIVYTDAVLEHFPRALQIEATKALAQAVDQDGLLIFLVDLSGPTEDDPMHHDVDIKELHNLLSSSGLRCEDGHYTFCSIWRRPR